MQCERNARLDKERFDLVVHGHLKMNATPLTHREACTMRNKLLPATQLKARLVSLGFIG